MIEPKENRMKSPNSRRALAATLALASSLHVMAAVTELDVRSLEARARTWRRVPFRQSG